MSCWTWALNQSICVSSEKGLMVIPLPAKKDPLFAVAEMMAKLAPCWKSAGAVPTWMAVMLSRPNSCAAYAKQDSN